MSCPNIKAEPCQQVDGKRELHRGLAFRGRAGKISVSAAENAREQRHDRESRHRGDTQQVGGTERGCMPACRSALTLAGKGTGRQT
jgi:hypothetical protein